MKPANLVGKLPRNWERAFPWMQGLRGYDGGLDAGYRAARCRDSRGIPARRRGCAASSCGCLRSWAEW